MRKIVIFLSVMVAFLQADYIIAETTKYSDGGVFESRSYYKQGYFKTVGDSETMIVDIAKDSVWFLYDDRKLYFGGKIDSVIDSIKSSFQTEMEGNDLEDQMPLPEDEKEVVIKQVGKGIKIGKFKTDKYQVLVAEELKEEVFIDSSIKPKIDRKTVVDFMRKLEVDREQEYELDENYLDLMKKGYPIRTILYGDDVVITEVKSIEKKSLALEEFLPPTEYKKVTPQEIFHID